jgi:hypothetical protein
MGTVALCLSLSPFLHSVPVATLYVHTSQVCMIHTRMIHTVTCRTLRNEVQSGCFRLLSLAARFRSGEPFFRVLRCRAGCHGAASPRANLGRLSTTQNICCWWRK